MDPQGDRANRRRHYGGLFAASYERLANVRIEINARLFSSHAQKFPSIRGAEAYKILTRIP